MDEKDVHISLNRRVKLSLLILLLIGAGFFGRGVMPKVVEAVNNSPDKKLPIYCVDTNEKKLSLTFDAAWGNEDLKRILDILDRQNVKATFFLTGDWIEKFPDDVKAIAAAGHDLGNHGENHLQMSSLNAERCKEEIMKVHDRIKDLTGIEIDLFRPPYGDYNNIVIETANDNGYHAVQWDVDVIDTKRMLIDSGFGQILCENVCSFFYLFGC